MVMGKVCSVQLEGFSSPLFTTVPGFHSLFLVALFGEPEEGEGKEEEKRLLLILLLLVAVAAAAWLYFWNQRTSDFLLPVWSVLS